LEARDDKENAGWVVREDAETVATRANPRAVGLERACLSKMSWMLGVIGSTNRVI
jgi:hypothetical protein